MIENEQRQALIQYRTEQAKASVNEAQVLIDNQMYRAAVNRIYYGMFYAVLALGLKHQFETSKHGQLIGWFNKKFIKEKVIDRKYGKILREAFEFRQQGDYATFIEFTKDDVIDKFSDMKEFISVIDNNLKNS